MPPAMSPTQLATKLTHPPPPGITKITTPRWNAVRMAQQTRTKERPYRTRGVTRTVKHTYWVGTTHRVCRKKATSLVNARARWGLTSAPHAKDNAGGQEISLIAGYQILAHKRSAKRRTLNKNGKDVRPVPRTVAPRAQTNLLMPTPDASDVEKHHRN